MKILQVIPFFSPKFGGSVTVPYELSIELSKRNHNVTIITSDYGFDSQYAKRIEEYHVAVIPFQNVVNLGLFIFTPSLRKWLVENLKNFDIIHLHNFRSYQNNIIHTYAIGAKIPYILQAHGSVLPLFEKQNLKKIYDLIWGNRILHDSDKVIALTEIESQQYQNMGVKQEKIRIIPNSINVNNYSQLPPRGKFKEKYGFSTKEKIILYLGRIHKIKGLDLLITAYIDIRKEMPETRLVIAGPDDNYLQKLERQISYLDFDNHYPLFTGPLYGEDKIAAYNDADIYVLPSHYETFPMTILEAFAMKTPVITTNNCGLAKMIRDNKAGFVINSDKKELTAGIIQILSNKGLRQSFTDNGENLLKKEFSTPTVISQYLDIYETLVIKKSNENAEK